MWSFNGILSFAMISWIVAGVIECPLSATAQTPETLSLATRSVEKDVRRLPSQPRNEVQWPSSLSYGPIHCIELSNDTKMYSKSVNQYRALAFKETGGDIYQRESILYWVYSCQRPQFVFSNITSLNQVFQELKNESDRQLVLHIHHMMNQGAREIPHVVQGPRAYAQILVNQKIDYSTSISRELAQRFGVNFAQEVFLAWLDIRFDLLNSQDAYRSQLRMILKSKDKIQFATTQLKNPVLFVVNGQAGLETDLMVQLAKKAIAHSLSTQVDYQYAMRKPVGSLRENIDLLKAQYLKVLQSGRDIYLFQISRGAQESLRAVAEINREYSLIKGEQSFPAGWGKFRSSVNIVPLFTGSFLADFGSSQAWLNWCVGQIEALLGRFERNLSNSVKDVMNYLVSGSKLTSAEINEAQRGCSEDYPTDVPQLVVTFFPKNGVYQNPDRFHQSMIAQWLYRRLSLVKTGHDNLIEVGGTRFPFNRNRQKYLVLDGTHMMNDVHMDLDGIEYHIKDNSYGPKLIEGLLGLMIENQN